MIEQIHVFQTHASEKTQSERVTLCENYRIPGNRCLYNTEQMADHIERQTGAPYRCLRPSPTVSLTFARSRRSSDGSAITASWIAASIVSGLSSGFSAHPTR